jgi:uncharacterized OsmC-like protein
MSENLTFSLELQQVKDFEFDVKFDWAHLPPLRLDEPEPLGHRNGPNASRLVGAAVGNCLSASLLFCLQKSKQTIRDIRTTVVGHLQRNERGRLRLGQFEVTIVLDAETDNPQRLQRCLTLFEDYCVVTASIRQAIPVFVKVVDPQGTELYASDGETEPNTANPATAQ